MLVTNQNELHNARSTILEKRIAFNQCYFSLTWGLLLRIFLNKFCFYLPFKKKNLDRHFKMPDRVEIDQI